MGYTSLAPNLAPGHSPLHCRSRGRKAVTNTEHPRFRDLERDPPWRQESYTAPRPTGAGSLCPTRQNSLSYEAAHPMVGPFILSSEKCDPFKNTDAIHIYVHNNVCIREKLENRYKSVSK